MGMRASLQRKLLHPCVHSVFLVQSRADGRREKAAIDHVFSPEWRSLLADIPRIWVGIAIALFMADAAAIGSCGRGATDG